MDACPRIWFYTPAQLAAQAVTLAVMFVGLFALALTC